MDFDGTNCCRHLWKKASLHEHNNGTLVEFHNPNLCSFLHQTTLSTNLNLLTKMIKYNFIFILAFFLNFQNTLARKIKETTIKVLMLILLRELQ